MFVEGAVTPIYRYSHHQDQLVAVKLFTIDPEERRIERVFAVICYDIYPGVGRRLIYCRTAGNDRRELRANGTQRASARARSAGLAEESPSHVADNGLAQPQAD